MRTILLAFIFLFFFSCSAQDDEKLDVFNIQIFNSQNVNKITETKIFDINDIQGKPYSRIPTIIIANNGNILAACEKRKEMGDQGEIDILLALSQNGGKSYNKSVIFACDAKYGRKMNPCFVVDRDGSHGQTGRIYCFVISILPLNNLVNQLSYRQSNTLYKYSDDNGMTWSDTYTLGTKFPNECTVFGPSPDNGIQLKNGTLVIPALVTLSNSFRTGIIFKTPDKDWQLNYIDMPQSVNESESTIIRYGDGNQILLNTRVENSPNARHVYYSNIIEKKMESKNINWNIHPSNSKIRSTGACQGSIEVALSNFQPFFLFSYPYDNPRNRICIWQSTDLIEWNPIYLLTTRPSAGYSVLTFYNNKLLAIYESDPDISECSIQDLSPLLPLLKKIDSIN